jgi:TRAP-type transport system periplasmic protein
VLTRRALMTTVTGAAFFTRPALAASLASGSSLQMELPGEYGQRLRTARRRGFHLHNQPADSPLHRALTSLWKSVFDESSGALMVTVLPLNANLPLDDAEAVYDVAGGRFEFVSVAAPIIDQLIPDIALQSLPFVYRNVDEVLTMTDQPDFSRLIEADLAHAGLALVAGGTFSNGFRVVVSDQSKPVRKLADLEGLKIRVPPSVDIALIFRTLGAVPVVTTIADMRDAFVAGKVEAAENPPNIIAAFGLQSVSHWINVTNHMWTGFNTLANHSFWSSLPLEVRDTILRLIQNVRTLQVAQQEALNADILRGYDGMEIIVTDISDAHIKMRPVYDSVFASFSPAARRLAEPLIERADR